MIFRAPRDFAVEAPLDAGSVFLVAKGRWRGAGAVCKRILPGLRAEPAAQAALRREAGFLAIAQGGSVTPALLEVGCDDEGPFVIEELVGGTSLREACGRRGAPPTRIFLELARSAAEAVASLHGLTKGGAKGGASCAASHGDLGPDHVFVDAAGALRFVDFGAARFVGMDPTLDTDDRGTLPYAAPEIARGEVKPDQAGDVYALAATLLFVARGGRPLLPFEDRAAMLLAIGDRGLPAVLFDELSLPDRVRDALRRALAFERSERLTTARELAAALEGD